MVQSAPQLLSVDEFINRYGDDNHYELIDGELINMEPTGPHEQVEVVSTNWQNDYARKVEDYAILGVAEYWIVDYLGVGGREYIGKPKQPTITVCTLVEDEYQKRLFRSNDLLVSSIFTELRLTAKQIFTAAH